MGVPARILAAVAAALACASGGAARADAVDDYLRGATRKAHIPAVAVAVVRDGRITKVATYGVANLEDGQPAAADTAFQLASGTKLFTGVLVMRMVEQGRLRLSDRLDAYLPDAPAAWRGVTVAQLAAHTSGIPDALSLKQPAADARALMAALKDQPMAYPPGSRSAYNQTEFGVLRLVLEKVSGRPFEALLDDEVVRPLGLTSTRFSNLAERADIAGASVRTADLVPHRAPLYAWVGGRQQITEFIYPTWSYAAGGLYSSAADLAKVLQALQTGRLVSPQSLGVMSTPYRLTDGRDGAFGVAWVVRRWRGRLATGHSGGPADSDIWLYPERRLAVAVLTDQQNFAPVLADGVARILDPAPPPSHAAVADDDPATSARLRAWTQGLADGRGDEAVFAPGAKALMAQLLAALGPALALSPKIDDWRLTASSAAAGGSKARTYAVRQGGALTRLTFYLDAQNRILALQPEPE